VRHSRDRCRVFQPAVVWRGNTGPRPAPGAVERDALLADRYYYSFTLWNEVKVSGAELLWRTKPNHVLPAVERLSDGSYLSLLHEVIGTHRRKSDVAVAVIEYGLDDPARTDTEDRYRLLTTLFDKQAAPAVELAALYTRRWRVETTLAELKTHERDPRVVLSSKAPDGVIESSILRSAGRARPSGRIAGP